MRRFDHQLFPSGENPPPFWTAQRQPSRSCILSHRESPLGGCACFAARVWFSRLTVSFGFWERSELLDGSPAVRAGLINCHTGYRSMMGFSVGWSGLEFDNLITFFPSSFTAIVSRNFSEKPSPSMYSANWEYPAGVCCHEAFVAGPQSQYPLAKPAAETSVIISIAWRPLPFSQPCLLDHTPTNFAFAPDDPDLLAEMVKSGIFNCCSAPIAATRRLASVVNTLRSAVIVLPAAASFGGLISVSTADTIGAGATGDARTLEAGAAGGLTIGPLR